MSHNEFLRARAALDAGDLATLRWLVDADVLGYRCFEGEWYESGYFAGAMLLHHVAGNPIRCPLPGNVIEITRLLLERGADPEARCGADQESTLAGLLLTSKQASDAGIAVPLLEMLLDAGASIDLETPGVLTYPLWNVARGTAEALVRRGTPMDLRHAAALGRHDVLTGMLDAGPDAELIEEALIFACVQGELESVRLLVSHGARGDRIGTYGPAPALHEAANRGYPEIVKFLLDHGADPTVRDRRFDGTALGWAEHGHPEHLATMRALLGKRKD
jgi:hypothetical protein